MGRLVSENGIMLCSSVLLTVYVLCILQITEGRFKGKMLVGYGILFIIGLFANMIDSIIWTTQNGGRFYIDVDVPKIYWQCGIAILLGEILSLGVSRLKKYQKQYLERERYGEEK